MSLHTGGFITLHETLWSTLEHFGARIREFELNAKFLESTLITAIFWIYFRFLRAAKIT